jgi:hypothetical protein
MFICIDLHLIVIETIRCKLEGEEGNLLRLFSMVEWLNLLTKPFEFSLLGCNSHQYIEWSTCGMVMTLITCSYALIFVELRNTYPKPSPYLKPILSTRSV